ncbi:MAG: lysophospholipid acyltransferase family protein, partial [Burkholderiales bacterium]
CWTVPQEYPLKRTRIFQAAERTLQRTGESVYVSPEGERVTTGSIGHFNKGAFHLATQLGVPIVPFYIWIPRASDPGMGLDARPGTIHVYVKPAIPTRDWKLADLERNRDRVRELFVRWHEELNPA